MNIIRYDKLVRDRIPQIIEASGKSAQWDVLDETACRQKLLEKLAEETAEYSASGDPEELADLLEIIYALGEFSGINPSQLETIRQEKAASRGGFRQRIRLLEVRDK